MNLLVENMSSPSQQPRRLCCEKCRLSSEHPEVLGRREVSLTCVVCEHVSLPGAGAQRCAFPYRCGWCTYGAVSRDHMVKHIKRVHGREPEGNLTPIPGRGRGIAPVGCPGPLGPGGGGSGPGGLQEPAPNRTCFTSTAPGPPPARTGPGDVSPALPPRVLVGVDPALTKRTWAVRSIGAPLRRTPACGRGKKSADAVPKTHAALPVPNINNTHTHTQAVLGKPRQPLLPGAMRDYPGTPGPPRRRTAPNILSRAPTNKAKLLQRGPAPPASMVQVELLEPLNQPLQHNTPLMVSCPEEISIPAGCLVELVEVKNVRGTRELELRLVPQRLGAPRSAGAPALQGHPRPVLQRPDLEGLPRAGPGVSVKSEPELSLRCCDEGGANAPRPPGLGSRVLEALAGPRGKGNPDAGPQQHPGGETTSRGGRGRGVSAQRKHTRPEFTPGGLPVISSVFSLCPVPQTGPGSRGVPEKQAGKPELSGPSTNGCLRSTQNRRVYRLDPKTEGEPTPLAEHAPRSNQEKKEGEGEGSRTSADVKPENQNLADVQKNGAPPLCGSSDVPLGDPAPEPPLRENVSPAPSAHLCTSMSMNPVVSLIRIPDLQSLSTRATLSVSGGGAGGGAELCHVSDQQNPQARSIKLVLKRKRDLLYVHLVPERKRAKKTRKRSRKPKPREQQLRLTPLKPDQLVRVPGPHQPVVVLNRPGPRPGLGWGQNSAVKMTLKKVQGRRYQVTQLLLKGVSERARGAHDPAP